MKKLNSETKIILFFSFIGILMALIVAKAIIEEDKFVKSELRKKVKQITTFRYVDCFSFTDGTSKCFSMYSAIDQNDTLTGVRLIRFISIGDSVIKQKNEALIRVVSK